MIFQIFSFHFIVDHPLGRHTPTVYGLYKGVPSPPALGPDPFMMVRDCDQV